MNQYTKIFSFVLVSFLLLGSGVSLAQNINNSNLSRSPYNRYGYGKMGSTSTAISRSMGDVGIAVRNNTYTNLSNPASLTAIDTLTMIFSMGLDGQYGTLQEGDTRETVTDAGFSYMTMHFPLWKDFAMSLSLTPYSTIGYYYGAQQKMELESSTIKHDTLTTASTYNGAGGINNFMMGLGWRFLRSKMYEASFGVNFGYLFGTIEHDAMLSTSSQATGTVVEHSLDARGLLLRMGLQYTHRLNATRSITVGATFQPQTNLSVDTHMLKYSNDTIQVNGRYRGDVKVPASFGIGLTYEMSRKLTLSAEFESTQWSKVSSFDPELTLRDDLLDDVNRFSIGMEYQPRTYSRNYLQTCRYRLGFSTKNDYLRVHDASLREYAVTAGFSLPVNKRSSLDFGFGYTRLQPSLSTMVKENYFTFTLGLTFNEMMFFRNKLR